MFRFVNRFARQLAIWGLVILAFPVALWLVSWLGGCTMGTMAGANCDHIPDFIGEMILAISMLAAFGGLIVYGLAAFAAVLMLGLALFLELEARRGTPTPLPKKKTR